MIAKACANCSSSSAIRLSFVSGTGFWFRRLLTRSVYNFQHPFDKSRLACLFQHLRPFTNYCFCTLNKYHLTIEHLFCIIIVSTHNPDKKYPKKRYMQGVRPAYIVFSESSSPRLKAWDVGV